MNIIIDDLTNPQIIDLLQEHLGSMHQHCPKDAIHAFDLESLRQPNVSFWSAWEDQELLGCAALLKHNSRHAELKSMRTAKKHLRKGVASTLLNHIFTIAKQEGINQISLETGSQDIFAPAIKLYERTGFTYCAPFAQYKTNPNNVFMTKYLF